MKYQYPTLEEFAPYFQGYTKLVREVDVMNHLKIQARLFTNLFHTVPAEKMDYAYAPGKWTIKEVIAHITDAERVFSYRALCLSRGEQKALPGFDENDYAQQSFANQRRASDLLDEFLAVRESSRLLFNGFTESQTTRMGTVSNGPMSVRALAYIILGHCRHHMDILHSRYLST